MPGGGWDRGPVQLHEQVPNLDASLLRRAVGLHEADHKALPSLVGELHLQAQHRPLLGRGRGGGRDGRGPRGSRGGTTVGAALDSPGCVRGGAAPGGWDPPGYVLSPWNPSTGLPGETPKPKTHHPLIWKPKLTPPHKPNEHQNDTLEGPGGGVMSCTGICI